MWAFVKWKGYFIILFKALKDCLDQACFIELDE